MTLLDVLGAFNEIKPRLAGSRLTNIYSINNNTYIFRFELFAVYADQQPDGTALQPEQDHVDTIDGTKKYFLIVENGIRMHLTRFQHPKSQLPNGFATKLRKHIRGLRVSGIRLPSGFDRVIEFQFKNAANDTFKIIFELYGKGNVILLDSNDRILSFLRALEAEDGNRLRVGTTYNFTETHEYPQNIQFPALEEIPQDSGSLKKWLTSAAKIPKIIVESVLLTHDTFQPNLVITKCHEILSEICEYPPKKGFVFVKEDEPSSIVEFAPYHFLQSKGVLQTRKTFNDAIDDFYIQQDFAKQEKSEKKSKKAAVSKVDRIKADHSSRLKKLSKSEELWKEQAQAIECNVDIVDRAITIINGEIAKGTDWQEMALLLNELKEDENVDESIQVIEKLNLPQNEITLKLFNLDSERHILVNVDLSLSAFSNSGRLYGMKKQDAYKAEKTKQATNKALKRAEKKGEAEANKLKKGTLFKSSNILKRRRKKLWFEKFYWFLSSDGFIVIGGRDAQQNERLVRHYLQKGDKYVHADLHGASSVIIKAPAGIQIPESTLMEAGIFTVCRSSAWDNKVITSAYWVDSEQVSKTAPTGQYLSTGSFMVRGKRNYLPPAALEMGVGVLFKKKVDASMVIPSQPVIAQKPTPPLEESIQQPEKPPCKPVDVTSQFLDMSFKERPQKKGKLPVKEEETPAPPKSTEVPRGKRSKLKRMKKKYKEQDEEERIARSKLLGTVPLSEDGQAIVDAEAKEEEKSDHQFSDDEEDLTKVCFRCQKLGHVVRDCPIATNMDSSEVSRLIREGRQEEQTEEAQFLEQGSESVPALSGILDEDGTYLESLVVCGPWASIRHLEFKARLVPGNMKRGQIAKAVLLRFMEQSKKEKNESAVDMIKGISMEEANLNLVGNSQVHF